VGHNGRRAAASKRRKFETAVVENRTLSVALAVMILLFAVSARAQSVASPVRQRRSTRLPAATTSDTAPRE
jgi:hypothetical protein